MRGRTASDTWMASPVGPSTGCPRPVRPAPTAHRLPGVIARQVQLRGHRRALVVDLQPRLEDRHCGSRVSAQPQRTTEVVQGIGVRQAGRARGLDAGAGPLARRLYSASESVASAGEIGAVWVLLDVLDAPVLVVLVVDAVDTAPVGGA